MFRRKSIRVSFRKSALLLALIILLSQVASVVTPFIQIANAQSAATTSDLEEYELASQFMKIWDTANTACSDPFGDQPGRTTGVLFENKIKTNGDDSYTDGEYYGLVKFKPLENNANFMVSQRIDNRFGNKTDRNLGCITAVKKLMVVVFGNRQKALQAMYDTSKTVDGHYLLKSSVEGDPTTFVLNKFREKAREIQAKSGFSGLYAIYGRELIKVEFEQCFQFNPGATDKSDPGSYENVAGKDNQGRKIGYTAEVLATGVYEDGKLDCDQISSAYFRLQLYDTSSDDEFQNDIKAQKIRDILKKDELKYIFCVGSADSELLKNMPGLDSLDIISSWLAAGDDTASVVVDGVTGEEISAATLKAIKDCLTSDGAFGQELVDAIGSEVTTSPPSSDTSGDTDLLKDCSDGNFGWNPIKWIPNALDWFGCTIIKGVLQILDSSSTWIAANLETTATTSITETTSDGTKNGISTADNALRSVWSGILKIANILFVIAFLLMIISTALNLGFIDAYTVKKYLPKIIIAVVLANLSWFIVSQAVDITNTLGGAVKEIILSPLKEPLQDDPGIAGSFNGATGASLMGIITVGVGTAVAPVLAGGWIVLLPTVLTLLFAALTAIVVLMIRKVLIFGLIVFAPIAITLWAIPGMDGWAKRWWKLLIEMLMVYPFIMAMFALGEFASIITLMTNDKDNGSIVPGLMAIAFLCIPLFLLPTVFKLASSTLGNITGMVNDKGKGLIDRSKRARGEAIGKGWDKIKGGRRFKQPNGEDSFRGRLNRGLQTASIVGTGKAGWRPSKMGAAAGMARSRQNLQSMKDFMENDETIKLFNKDDDKLHALVHGEDEAHVRSILENSAPDRFGGANNRLALDQAVAEVMEAKKKGGHSARIAAVMAQAATGTAYDTVGEMLDDINAVAGGDRTMAGLMLADMKGAAMQSGRVDLGGAGFAHMQGVMERRRASQAGGPAFSTDDATADVLRNVIASQGGREASYGKRQGAVQIAQAHHQYIQDTIASANNGTVMEIDGVQRAATERDVKQALAAAANAHDVISAASPQNGRAFADNLFGQDISLTPTMQNSIVALPPGVAGPQLAPPSAVSVKAAMDLLSGSNDGEYAEMRRDYGTGVDAQAAAQAQGAQPPGPAAPPGGVPGGLPPAPSDYRLKRDVLFIGKSPSGINIYKFKYLWSDTEYVGVIAQEIRQILPAAIHYTATGYMSVDYAMLDVKMQKLDEWEDSIKYVPVSSEGISVY